MIKDLAVRVGIAAMVACCSAEAADFRSEKIGQNGGGALYISGALEPGDGNTFHQWVSEFDNRGIPLRVVFLRSRGGSLNAAWEIASVVRARGVSTVAPSRLGGGTYAALCSGPRFDTSGNRLPAHLIEMTARGYSDHEYRDVGADCSCMSACTVIWAAGVGRHGDDLWVHRPHRRRDNGAPHAAFEQADQDVVEELARFYRSMGITETIGALMRSTPATSIAPVMQEDAARQDNIEHVIVQGRSLCADFFTRHDASEPVPTSSGAASVRRRAEHDLIGGIIAKNCLVRHGLSIN